MPEILWYRSSYQHRGTYGRGEGADHCVGDGNLDFNSALAEMKGHPTDNPQLQRVDVLRHTERRHLYLEREQGEWKPDPGGRPDLASGVSIQKNPGDSVVLVRFRLEAGDLWYSYRIPTVADAGTAVAALQQADVFDLPTGVQARGVDVAAIMVDEYHTELMPHRLHRTSRGWRIYDPDLSRGQNITMVAFPVADPSPARTPLADVVYRDTVH